MGRFSRSNGVIRGVGWVQMDSGSTGPDFEPVYVWGGEGLGKERRWGWDDSGSPGPGLDSEGVSGGRFILDLLYM